MSLTPVEHPIHLVIVDTCSLLDIVRAPLRSSLALEPNAADAVRSRAINEPGVTGIAICDVSVSEFHSRIENVVIEVQNHLRHHHNGLIHIDEVAKQHGLPPLLNERRGWEEDILGWGRRLAETILSMAKTIPITTEDRERASVRTIERRAPARQGSAATHDCWIAEGSMRVATGRPTGYTYLLTSNVSDFGGNGERLDPDLATDFDEAGVVYATSWREVAGRLDAEIRFWNTRTE